MLHVHMRRICILLLLHGMLFKYRLSIRSDVSFMTCVFLLVFCLDDLSICPWNWGVKPPLLLCYCWFVPLKLLALSSIYWGAPLLDLYKCILFISFWIYPLIIMQCPSLYLIAIFILKPFCLMWVLLLQLFKKQFFHLREMPFFHPFTLYVSLDLKWVSCIFSGSLCLLDRTFNPFTHYI